MDSANDSFTMSRKETLLFHNDEQPPLPSKKTRTKNLKTIIFFALFILIILIAGSMILSSILMNKRKPNAYLSSSSRYYCHLTPYPELCYTSMSSIINTTALNSNPGPIFTTSLLIAIHELNHTAISITKALSSSSNKSNPLVGPGLSECQQLVHDSLSLLKNSLGMLGDDSDIESFSYVETDEYGASIQAARRSVGQCFLALDDLGVEEVNLGLEKANKLIINGISLFKRRQSILFDFYNPFYEMDDYYYDYYSIYNFEFRFLICLYSVMYLFLALLYFLFWRGN